MNATSFILDFFGNENILAYLIAYLIAGIPFGLILAKIFGKVNITKVGSHSIGATNVLRALKETNPKLAKKIAILTVVCDALKGLIPILIAKFVFNLSEHTLWAMAVFAIIGHCFSVYLKFQGGKGIATGAGVFAYLLPIELCVSLLIWYIVAKVFRISSLASFAALFSIVISSFIIHYDMPVIHTHAPVLIIGFIVFYKHIPNLIRLISKNETKVA